MAIVSNYAAQSALISWLKSRPAIVAELIDEDEIKEDQWGGTAYAYPGIRVRLISNQFVPGQPCFQTIMLGIQVYTEDASSLNADRIAGIIANELDNKKFITSGIQFSTVVTNLVPAYHRDAQTWMSEVLISANLT